MSQKDQTVSKDLLTKVENEMDLDNQLLGISNKFMDRCLESIFENQLAKEKVLKEFEIRCENLEKNQSASIISKLISRLK